MTRDFEPVDRDYEWVKIPFPSFEKAKSRRKMKCKKLSFRNISSFWKNFRLDRLKRKLAKKTDKLVEMEFSNAQLTPGIGRNITERRVLAKTKSIAKLEAKINFLETGMYQNEEFVDSRAIKLKNIMMSNLEHNRNSAYGLSEIGRNQIYGIEDENQKSIDEEGANIGAKVKEIMEKKKSNTENSNEQKPIVPVPTTTGSSNEQQPIVPVPVTTVPENTAQTDIVSNTGETVSSESVAQAIQEEMDKIKVEDTTTRTTTVNPFVNEDGTYRLKKEDIDEEFRINKFDRSQLTTEVKDLPMEQNSEESVVEPFKPVIKRKIPEFGGPKKEITALAERKTPITFEEIIKPEIKKTEETSSSRIQPVVVPERVLSQAETPSEKNEDDISSLIDRVAILRREREKIAKEGTKAQEKAAILAEKYIKTKQDLTNYADELERECNASYATVNAVNEDSAEIQAKIDAMIEMMATVPQSDISGKRSAK